MGLDVGDIPVPEESALSIALTLLRIFPRIEIIDGANEGGGRFGMQSSVLRESSIVQVRNAPSLRLEVSSTTTLQEPHSRPVVKRERDQRDNTQLARISSAQQKL
jgi:hypothetical protein